MEAEEKGIVFGKSQTWVDVEADEATFDKRDISQTPGFQYSIRKNQTIMWEQWADVVQPGRPQTLLVQASPQGPGAIRKMEWKTISDKLLKNRKVILHTDAANSYKIELPGVLRDNVAHCRKQVQVRGKLQWTEPEYVNKLIRYHYVSDLTDCPVSLTSISNQRTAKIIPIGGCDIIDDEDSWRNVRRRNKKLSFRWIGKPELNVSSPPTPDGGGNARADFPAMPVCIEEQSQHRDKILKPAYLSEEDIYDAGAMESYLPTQRHKHPSMLNRKSS